MATRIDSEYPPSPTNNESDDEEEQDEPMEDDFEEEKYDTKSKNNGNGFADILKRLESAGALLKKPKKEYCCKTCDEDFVDWEDLESHLYQHVSLPSVVLERLLSDEEDTAPSDDENWSDDEELQVPLKQEVNKAPQKVDISQILKKTGLTIKKNDTGKSSDAALNKLSNLGFTIKKSGTPIKTEKIEEQKEQSDERNKKIGNIKLRLKSDGTKFNTFKVINGLKGFRPSDDDDDGSEAEGGNDDESSDDKNANKYKKSHEEGDEDFEADSDEEQFENNSRRSSGETGKNDLQNQMQKLQGKRIKIEPIKIQKSGPQSKIIKQLPAKIANKPIGSIEHSKEIPKADIPIARPSGRPSVKQTPKRGPNNPLPIKSQEPQQTSNSPSPTKEVQKTPERRESHEVNTENVVVKQEIQDSAETEAKNVPLLSQQIKSERTSPSLDRAPTPIIAKVKTEPGLSNATPAENSSFVPVTKTEDTNVTIIEINGDSNDEDDDCCVVSATPAPDVKPIVPKTEAVTPLPPPVYSSPMPYPASSQPSFTGPSILSSRLSSTPSLEKQHNFNWNAPDSKQPIDMLEKSADDIFESLLSSSSKKENMSSLSDVNEYISLDTLGPKHTCEVCNTRFTDISLFEEHKRMTGHSNSLVATPSSSTLLPYNSASNLLSSLLPGKLAEQVGKLSTIGNTGPGFTHQQNVMINIQAYPGAGGVMQPPQPYNSYAPQVHNQQGAYPQSPNMYTSSPGQNMPGQYPGPTYPQSPGYGQYPTPMSTSGYPGSMPPNVYSSASSPYSTSSPLQSMQQAVYGQSASGAMSQQPPTMMGPPGSSSSQGYSSASSPSAMKQSGNIRIQNVQTFPPGHLGQTINPGQTAPSGQQVGSNQQPMHGQEMSIGQTVQGQITTPTPIRMAVSATNPALPRTRMPTVRGPRQPIRPAGLHGQVRGGVPKGPRMTFKRPGQVIGGTPQKRRADMLLPGKHDNEDCQVMSMQKQREGLPLIHSVQGAKDKLNLGSQISITKKTVNKEANAMANVLASRGISVKQKQKSRSPTPPRALPNLPNIPGVSIKHSSRSSNFSIPEAKIGGGMLSCKICKKMFMSSTSLSVHMSNAHPQSKLPVFKCDECPASYPKSLQLQHHKRVFHNVTGPDRELGLPVVDLSQEDNLQRLSNLGIYSFIPLANREQGNGCFGIPVISVHNVQNGLTSGLQALGADGLLSLGPLKPLPNS